MLSKISASVVDQMQFYSIEPSDPGLLARSFIIADLVEAGTIPYPWLTVVRLQFHSVIVAEATETYGIPILYDHSLVDIRDNTAEETVTVRFSNGKTDTGSFLVGCDGLHSNTRVALFGRQKAQFTGMTQVSFSF